MSVPDRDLDPAPVEVWTVFDGRGADDRPSRRVHDRSPVESCRPIALQLVDGEGLALSGWQQADILDVSLGGFCLLLMEDVPLDLAQMRRLRLDVRAHPSFGVDDLMADVRWFVRSGLTVSIGVGFDDPLQELPELLACRRSERRPFDRDLALD